MSGKEISLRCQCTCLQTSRMSREGSPARDVAARAGSSKEGSSKEGSAAITGDQFAQLMEEVRRSCTGDAAPRVVNMHGGKGGVHVRGGS